MDCLEWWVNVIRWLAVESKDPCVFCVEDDGSDWTLFLQSYIRQSFNWPIDILPFLDMMSHDSAWLAIQVCQFISWSHHDSAWLAIQMCQFISWSLHVFVEYVNKGFFHILQTFIASISHYGLPSHLGHGVDLNVWIRRRWAIPMHSRTATPSAL